MIYYEALIDITSALDDPEGDRLFERAKDHLIRAISTLMAEGQWNENDLPGYWTIKTDVSFTDTDGDSRNYEDLDGLDVMRIVDVFPRPWAAVSDDIYDQTVRLRSIEHIAKVTQSARYRPGDTTIWIWRNGLRLYIYFSTGNVFAGNLPLTGDNQLIMRYLKFPDNSGWDDSATAGAGGTELVGSLFSKPFIDRAVNMAIQSLGQEDTL